jgi:hypothetical protein
MTTKNQFSVGMIKRANNALKTPSTGVSMSALPRSAVMTIRSTKLSSTQINSGFFEATRQLKRA